MKGAGPIGPPFVGCARGGGFKEDRERWRREEEGGLETTTGEGAVRREAILLAMQSLGPSFNRAATRLADRIKPATCAGGGRWCCVVVVLGRNRRQTCSAPGNRDLGDQSGGDPGDGSSSVRHLRLHQGSRSGRE